MNTRRGIYSDSHLRTGLVLLLLLLMSGCGRSGRPTGTVSGTVTYKGAPVPSGTVAFFGANDSAASFRMATKSKFGKKEYVEWHSVVAFRELAQEVVEKCTKGRFVRVYGYLHHSNGGNDDGAQFETEVVATRIKYLDRKK